MPAFANSVIGLSAPAPKTLGQACVNNITDKLGITGGELESAYLTYAYHFVQRPRTVGVQLRYKFK